MPWEVIGVLALGSSALLYVTVFLPLKRLLKRLRDAEGSDFLVRMPEVGGIAGQLGAAVNRILAKMTDMNVQSIDQRRELDWAQERLDMQADLDRANAELERRLVGQMLLNELTETFSSSLDISAVLSTVCSQVARALTIDEVVLVRFDPASGDLVVAACEGLAEPAEVMGLRFEIGEGVTGEVWDDADTVYIPDTSADDRFLHWKGRHELGSASFVAIRMEYRGEKLGLLDCTRRRTNGFTLDEIDMLKIIAKQAGLAVRNASLYERTLELATHDELTGLLNRRRFLERLDSEWQLRRRYGDAVGLLIVDVDHFKAVNDTMGHLEGDRVLRDLARLLNTSVRKVDLVARYGGEEFVILLPRATPETAQMVAEKLRLAVEDARIAPVGDAELGPTVSVGAACATPSTTDCEPLDLVAAADAALFQAKERGRNQVVVAPNLT